MGGSSRQAVPAGADAGTPWLEARALGMDFGNGPVVDGVDLTLGGGGLVGLIGPNGAGKTTLLSLFMGLLRPSAGGVWVAGRPVGSLSRRRLAQTMALVPQHLDLGFALPALDVVALGRYPYLGRFHAPGAADRVAVEQAMATTGVSDLAGRAMDTLSGGERQRVLIARALAQDTPVILLDEVTASLDLSHQLEVLELAARLAADGRLVIAAIHDLTLASRYCARLLLLSGGRLCADGPPAAVLTPARLRRHFCVDAHVEPGPDGAGLIIVPRLPARSGG